MRPPISQLLDKTPWQGLLLDGLTLLFAWVAWEPAVQAVTPLLPWLFWLIPPMHMLGVWCGLTFGEREAPPKGWLWDALLTLKGLALVLAIGGFLWLFVPAAAIQNQTGHFPGSFVLQFFVMLFGGILVFGLRMEADQPMSKELSFLGVGSYLLFTELMLAACAESGVPGPMAAFALAMAYFPMRYALAMRPPFSLWELATASLAFISIVREFFI